MWREEITIYSYSAGINFRHQNLTSVDFRRQNLTSTYVWSRSPRCKSKHIYIGRTPITMEFKWSGNSQIRHLGQSLVFYPRPIEEWFSRSHDAIGQSPPSFIVIVTWADIYKYFKLEKNLGSPWFIWKYVRVKGFCQVKKKSEKIGSGWSGRVGSG